MAEGGSLTVVGTGIRFGLQTTQEARTCIERAGKVLYLLTDPVAAEWIERLNPSSESLAGLYAPGKPRAETYGEMVEEILRWVRKGLEVCVALYGHPGVFAEPAHHAVETARAEGFPAQMLPGVSAEDCLFADLGVDPGDGCQSYEATDFLIRPPIFDPGVSLVLWQVAGVGARVGRTKPAREGLRILSERLLETYGGEHEVVLYEAPLYPIGRPSIRRMSLADLAPSQATSMATLYVPPQGPRRQDAEMAQALEKTSEDSSPSVDQVE
jgi:uncharacterized protein YabN with tetrapyrrole methylase and pyrophosphatase domain